MKVRCLPLNGCTRRPRHRATLHDHPLCHDVNARYRSTCGKSLFCPTHSEVVRQCSYPRISAISLPALPDSQQGCRYCRNAWCLSVLGLRRHFPNTFPPSRSHRLPPPLCFACGLHRSHHSPQRPSPPSTLHGTMDMSSSNSSSVMDMMVPYLHFTGGDNLLFEAWHPSSKGAIAGACIGLVLFAIFERWVNGMRGVLEARWRQQCVPCSARVRRHILTHLRAMATMMSSTSNNSCHASGSPSSLPGVSKMKEVGTSGVEEVNINASPSQPGRRLPRPLRTVPPFIPSHDIPRGALFAFQALLYYVLMLAVMCVQ